LGALYQNHLPFHGAIIDVTAAGVPAHNKASLFWGLYEGAERRFVHKYLHANIDVVEVGSSIGAISSQIGQRLNANRRLICVEGNPRIQRTLAGNIARNCDHLNTEIVAAAIAYGDTEVEFGLANDNLDSRTGSKDGQAEYVRVPAITLSNLLREKALGDYQLVADIEGAELDILNHDGEALANCKRIVIELHDVHHQHATTTVADIKAKFESNGFVTLEQYGRVLAFENCSQTK
jgi:FkbM family methyltransferase